MSHHMMQDGAMFWFLSTTTSPCIWNAMATGVVSGFKMEAFAISTFVAGTMYCHHSAGSCAAHPGQVASLYISCLGSMAAPARRPVSASNTDALIDELPRS